MMLIAVSYNGTEINAEVATTMLVVVGCNGYGGGADGDIGWGGDDNKSKDGSWIAKGDGSNLEMTILMVVDNQLHLPINFLQVICLKEKFKIPQKSQSKLFIKPDKKINT